MVLFNVYLLRLGYGPEYIGLVNGLGLLSLAVCSLPAGVLGARWGSRRAMIVGMALMTVGFWLGPMAELIPVDWRSVWIVAAWSLVNLSAPLFTVNGTPFLMAATTPDERDHAFSLQAAVLPLAGVAGSLAAGALPGLFSGALAIPLDQPAPYRYPLLLAGLMFLIGLIVTLATRDNELDQERSDEAGADRSEATAGEAGRLPLELIGVMGVVLALGSVGQWVASGFFNVYLDAGLNVPALTIGRLAAAGQLVAGVATLAMPLLIERWGKLRVNGLGILALALALLPLALIPHWAAAGGGYTAAMALGTMLSASLYVYAQELVSPGRQSVMSGVLWMSSGIGGAAMMIVGGYLVEAYGFPSLFLTAAGVTAAGGLLYLGYFRTPRGELARKGADPQGAV
jgi:MFS family permease